MFAVTGFSAGWRANNFDGARLDAFHIDFHWNVAKEEVAQAHAEDNGDENPSTVHHHTQHDTIGNCIMEQEHETFIG